MSPRIAILCEYPTVLGGERSMLAVMEVLQREGWSFAAFVLEDSALAMPCAAQGVEIVPWSPRETTDDELLDRCQQLEADLIHANSTAMSRRLGRVAERLHVPCTGHLRDIVGLSGASVFSMNRLHGLIAVSEATRQFHIGQGIAAERMETIYNGITPRSPATLAERQQRHHELGLDPSTPLVIAVGQISLRKGTDLLADAAIRLWQQRPDVHVVHLGERWSQKAETVALDERLEQSIRESGYAANWHRLGFRADALDWIAAADVLVHPARQEPLGRVLLEALVVGTPVVATDVGGTREILDDDVHGRLVPADDAVALSDAVLSLLSDTEQRERYRQAGWQRVCERFDLFTAAKRTAEVWQRAITIGA